MKRSMNNEIIKLIPTSIMDDEIADGKFWIFLVVTDVFGSDGIFIVPV